MPPNFVLNFILEGVKKGIIHMRNIITYLVKYFYFLEKKTREEFVYISGKEYSKKLI